MSLAYAILGLLSCQDMTGYDLKYYFDASVKHIWPAHLSQIYRELKGLEKKQWVDSFIEPQETRPDRRVYRITGLGSEEFGKWLNKVPDSFHAVARDETTLRVFFGSKLAAEELVFQLQLFLKEKKEVLSFLEHIERTIRESSFESEKRYWLFSLRKGFKVTEAEISWAEECIQELQSLPDRAPSDR
ncbi:PadR family transcriptional regulator [Paenibacillus thiaminolyticus]|nr:PadR family transcriptional regulator [Paenibacillus thiaminolyticus]MCY9536430.1 PadR family transcriptional regulator [Paenibacillus thiaminolyticus]MCY9601442.1 PadR family transcriptional regulator [Paenibacillus thiaminolyticus]MCY9609236.1 PadR family transcriptional regulator [Paenibacillus thiaminolyticus]MCY9613097.1 PadR family transcriptional regulator [Paenibacillus thiaminolyticus]MCY9616919.1 PadR family transcriptional regulator [Paenibacillus thiaminolyticus]